MSVLEVVSSNPVAGRTPPHNLEAEKSVLGSVFIKPAAFDEVATNLGDGRLLPARAPRDLRGDGGDRQAPPGDRRHRRRRRAEDARHARRASTAAQSYLNDLANAVPTAENVLHYARLVREKATLRRLIAACAEVQSSAYGDFGEFETFLDEAETKIFKVAQQNRRETYSATGDLMEEVLHNLEVRTAERQAR